MVENLLLELVALRAIRALPPECDARVRHSWQIGGTGRGETEGKEVVDVEGKDQMDTVPGIMNYSLGRE